LGKPPCGPPPNPDGVCYPDGKPLTMIHWLPSLSPIAGHVWLLRHAPFGDPYAVAELDAPWQVGATKIHVPAVEQWYKRAVIDWWAVDWRAHPIAASAIGLVLAMGFGSGVVLWRRRTQLLQ